jgi:hypothetical protein
MKTTDVIRNGIIDKLLTITDEGYLRALFQLLDKRNESEETVQLSEEQIQMLHLSEDDIAEGRLVLQNQLDQDDLLWIKGL